MKTLIYPTSNFYTIASKTYFVIALFFMWLIAACTDSNAPTATSKMRIVATTGMIKDAVQNIVKDRADVSVLMGPGVDPHLYKATQSDLMKISYAKIIFYNGLFLEGKMSDILKKAGHQRYVIPMSDGIDTSLILHAENIDQASNATHVYDPHIWFDVAMWAKGVAHISNELQRIDTINADFYRQNALAYIAQLEELDAQIKRDIATIAPEQRVLITSHDAFRYFGRAYNMEVKGLQGISTVTEFGLKDVSDMTNLIISRKIKAVFVESSVPQKSLEAVIEGCKQLGWELEIGGTLYSDAMGQDNSPEGTYIGMLQANVKTLVNALK